MAEPGPRFLYLLSVAQRRVQGALRAGAGDVTAAQAGALFLIGPAGALVGDVARGLGVGLPGASGLVDRMVEAGLVERRPDARDGRSSRLFLTARGRGQRERAQASAAALNARLVAGFRAPELAIVSRWLAHVATEFAPAAHDPEDSP